MTFVDTNVFVYAVGQDHPLQRHAEAFFASAIRGDLGPLCTSAEVLQELLHVYLRVGRMKALDDALGLLRSAIDEIWPLTSDDVIHARTLADTTPGLSARDLVMLAACRRRGVRRIKTYDRALAAAFE